MPRKPPRLRLINTSLSAADVRSVRPLIAHQPDRAEVERIRKAGIDKSRQSAAKRGYDADWRRLRDQVVIERGCRCELCGTLVALRKRDATPYAPAAHVDHIQSIQDAPDRRLDRTNLRLLCEPCHDRRTAVEQGFGRWGRGQ